MEFTIKLKKYRDPAKGNWTTDLTGGYENIRGKAYDFFKYAEGDRVLDKNGVEVEPPQYTSSGYWGAKGELTGLIKGFKNPVSQAEVNIEKIEDTIEATQEWDKMTPGDQYYLYVAMSVAQSLESKYKKEFGIEIKLDVIKVPVKPKDPAPKDPPKEIPSTPGKADASAKYVSAQNSADGTPTKITYDIIKDGAAIARIEASPIFKYDKDTKKITIVAKEVFYEADALEGQLWTWNMKYGKSEFVSMDSVLILQGYPPEAVPANTTADPAGATPQSGQTYGEMTFDVREENTFFNQKMGKLYLIGTGKIPKEKLDAPGTDDYEDDEYVEEDSDVTAELAEDFITGLQYVDSTDPELEKGVKVGDGPAPDTKTNMTPGGGTPTETLRPTKAGHLQGPDFTQTIRYKKSWNVRVPTEYKLTGFIYGKPSITEEGYKKRVKAAEGGIANGKKDGMYKKHKDKTVVAISKKDYQYASKPHIIKLCTNAAGKRLHDIHTNKGITYLVFKNAFGVKTDEEGEVEFQKKFLRMSDEDWWKVNKERFLDPCRVDEIKSKITAYTFANMTWGAGLGGSLPLLSKTLNLLSGTNNFKSTSKVTDAYIDYMNKLYDEGKEDILISALYDVRFQFFLNISQPGVDNAEYRTGWLNGMNKWIQDFHDQS